MIDARARLDALGSHRAVPWILAATFAALGTADVLAGTHLHDEGQLTLLFARLLGDAPLDVFFWQKSRPPISLLYAPFAALGPTAFGIAHVVVAALGIVALARIAAHLGQRWPNVAALVLAASPLYFACAASGVSNSDGVALALVGAWSWHARGRVATGAFVLGMVPWVRAELAPLVLALAIVCPREQRRRAWPAIVAFGVAYGLMGAVFHRDALWWAYYPPALPTPMANHPLWATQDASLDAAEIAATLLALSPAWLLAIPWRGGAAPKLQWVWLGFAAFELGVLLAMPRWRAFNFDLSPRYLLGVVPGVALAASWAIATLGESSSWRTRAVELGVLLGGAAFALAAAAQDRHPTALAAMAMVAAAVAIGRAGHGGAAAIVAVGLVLVGPFGFADGSKLATWRTSPELLLAERRLAEDPALATRPVYTNLPLLAARLRDRSVHYIVQTDQLHEIVTLTNPTNGQRARVLAALERGFFGTPVFPGAMVPEQLPVDALLLLQDDPRLSAVLPPATWEPALRILSQSPTLRIAELAARRSR
jgi:hypothetical protein